MLTSDPPLPPGPGTPEADEIWGVRCPDGWLVFRPNDVLIHPGAASLLSREDAELKAKRWPGLYAAAAIVGVSPARYASLQSEIARKDDLLRRAMTIINSAIMHGMPITEEVATVRNAIVCGGHHVD